MSGWCLVGVWNVPGGCLEVSGGCLELGPNMFCGPAIFWNTNVLGPPFFSDLTFLAPQVCYCQAQFQLASLVTS